MAMSSSATTRRVLTVLALAGVTGIVPLAGSASATHRPSSPGATQGGSESNPDGAGVDKPFPADGQPAESQGSADFDGNNGCGNDDDRADDNNGLCGGPKKDNDAVVAAPVVVQLPVLLTAPAAQAPAAQAPAVKPPAKKARARTASAVKPSRVLAKPASRVQPASVLGVRIVRPGSAKALAVAPTTAQALGAAQVAGASLPRTGTDVPLELAFMVGSLMVVAGGTSLSLGRARQ